MDQARFALFPAEPVAKLGLRRGKRARTRILGYKAAVSPDPLPIDEVLAPLLRALRSAQAVVVEAAPGSGKSTELPRALLEAGWATEREIWVAEPRRLAAQLAAEIVARQLGESVGQRVGYRGRFEQRVGPETRLCFVTDGALLERLASPERGTGIGVVVLDDFHERRLASELSLILLRRRLKSDAGLRIVVLSPGSEPARLAAYLGDAPRLRCAAVEPAVEIEHPSANEDAPALPQRVAGAVERLVDSARGDILAFLPGASEIERAKEALHAWAEQHEIDLVTLHGELPLELAARALAPGRRRRVVLATDVAESAICVQGVGAVIDSGLARSAQSTPWSDRQNFELRPISRASAARRAARVSGGEAGRVVRLYTAADPEARPEHEPTELQRLELTRALLTLYACKVPVGADLWLDPPPEAALDAAREQLQRLGLASGDRLTELGRRACALPVPPRLARVALAGAERGIPRRACLAVALLAELEIRVAAASAPDSSGLACDIEHSIALYASAEAQRFAPPALQRLGLRFGRVDSVRRCFERLLENLIVREPVADEASLDAETTRRALGLALLAAFPERVARRRERSNVLLLSTGQSAELLPESVAQASSLLLAVEAEERSGGDEPGSAPPQVYVRVASPIETEWLIEYLPQGLSERELLEWDVEGERAILISQLCWGEVVLQQSERPAYPGIVTGALVERAALVQLSTLFVHADRLPELVARTELIAEHLPELGFQHVNELGTRGLLHAACQRVISLAELRELDWGAVFVDQLSAEQRRELERQAPVEVVLKGGRRLRVQYARGHAPSIEARLQDFFGMPVGPVIVGGHVPLTLRLLAPNDRAVQVTADLAEFWARDYSDLRRELSRRYPRDAWPEEPRTATAPAPRNPR
jgi:ATP-dependent helicase HrpB